MTCRPNSSYSLFQFERSDVICVLNRVQFYLIKEITPAWQLLGEELFRLGDPSKDQQRFIDVIVLTL